MIKISKAIASELLALHIQDYTPTRGTHVPAPVNICGVVARYVDLDAPEKPGWTTQEWTPAEIDADFAAVSKEVIEKYKLPESKISAKTKTDLAKIDLVKEDKPMKELTSASELIEEKPVEIKKVK